MDNQEKPTQNTVPFSEDGRTLWWKISTIALLIISIALAAFLFRGYLQQTPVETDKSSQLNEIQTEKNTFSFLKQNLEQSLSQYDAVLLASPDLGISQRNQSWKPLDCLYSEQQRDSYGFSEIEEFITDQNLIKGLKQIENHEFSISILNPDGSLNQKYQSKQNIDYTQICKNNEKYYVLFLTTGDKNSQQSSLFDLSVYAAGGWSGSSNLATISFSGEASIFENLNSLAYNISISELVESGFGTPTSRSFAYYACRQIVGELGDDLYIVCGGSGASGLFQVSFDPLSSTELAFCWWRLSSNERVCYDTSGKQYYSYRQ